MKRGRRDRQALTARDVQTLKARPDAARGTMYGDGRGLYLRVMHTGAKHWVFRYALAGKQTDLGLGVYPEVTLEQARDMRDDLKRKLRIGVDPMSERKLNALKPGEVTFKQTAIEYMDTLHKSGKWKAGGRVYSQWMQSFNDYVFPTLGDVPVGLIDARMVKTCLEAHWATKRETMDRARRRMENTFDYATAHGYRTGNNPAIWKGNLQMMGLDVDAPTVEHHAAMAYADIGRFMAELRGLDRVDARCLEFLILTASRSGEARGARWEEFDFAARVWNVPAERMKMDKPHTVPLNTALLDVLNRQGRQSEGLIFTGSRHGRELKNARLQEVLGRLGRNDVTVHGFRATFRTWGEELHADVAYEAREMCVAHVTSNAAARAYIRTDYLEQRRPLMEDWAAWCDKPAVDTLTPMRRAV